jgi:hypothetical protein
MTKKVKPTKEANTGQGAALIQQLQQRFAGFWQRLVAPGGTDEGDSAEYVREYLNSLKERAYLERTIANQYRGRFLLELIQNAVDSMHRQANQRKSRAKAENAASYPYRCQIELTREALYIANDGLSFEDADVRGICAMGQSTKPAGEYIGYKGLGFRAVLEITDTPEIYSGQYEFGFSRPETLALLETPGAPAGLNQAEVPILTVPHLRSAEELPEADREIVARLKKAGYATIIRLPLKQRYLYQEIRENCEQLLNNHTLLFLPYITALSVALPGQAEEGVLLTIEKSRRELSLKPPGPGETVQVSRLTFRRSETPFPPTKGRKPQAASVMPVQEDWLLVEPREPLAIESPELVTELEDPTWKQLKQVQMALAFPLARMPWGGGEVFLKRRPEPLPFFAHFPTQEGSGLGLAVNADFYLSASRKQIEWNVPYNRWLAQEIVRFISGSALDAVHYLHPDEANLIEILLDYPYYNDQFGRNFRERLDSRLASSAFIPVGNGRYMPPDRVVWTPLGQEGVLLFRRVFRYPGQDLFYPVLQLEEVYTTNQPEPERELFAKNPNANPDFDFEADRFQTDYFSDKPSFSESYDRDSRSYDYDPYDDSRYEHDPYSNYNDDPYNDSPKSSIVNGPGPRSRQSSIEEGFDYSRMERFLSSLGVRKISPSRLSEIFPQSLEAWDAGVVLTGEICAVLALWYDALLKEGSGGSRILVDQAKRLPVLPTLEEGWQRPDERRFTFRDSPQPQTRNLDEQSILISENFRPPDGRDAGQNVLLIDPEAYALEEFGPLVRRWHTLLGVRPASKT